MNQRKKLNQKRAQRIRRVRALVRGTALRPRLAVRRTNRYFYAQLIDDAKGRTLVSVSNLSNTRSRRTGSSGAGGSAAISKTPAKKSDQAFAAGEALGKKAVERGITQAVFDRRSYQFHGRVKNFAEGAKKGGLKI